MKHQDLKDHMKGSFLQKHYLDAFLAQSAYIESMLKLYGDFSYFKASEGKLRDSPILNALHRTIERYGLNELIQFLYNAKLITQDQKKSLNNYKFRRNRILHDLLKEIRKDTFDKELQETYLTGEKIIEGKSFMGVEGLINFLEEESIKDNKQPVLEISPLNKTGSIQAEITDRDRSENIKN